MELHRLRYFVAVAETGSFTGAARREGVTQPTLSQQILELEKELDTRLFDRLGRNVVLTTAGNHLLPHAQGVLAALADAERSVRASTSGGVLRAGAIPTIAPYLLPPVARRFLKEHATVHLQLLEDRTERLLDALLAGELDVGVMALPIRDDRLHVEKLFTEELVVAVPTGHRLAGKPTVRLADLSREPFLLLDDFHCFGDQVMSFCRQSGKFEPRVACKGEQIGTLLGLVAGGMGVTVVPKMAADADRAKRLAFLSFAPPTPSRTLCAVWHKQRFRPPAVRQFLEILSEVGDTDSE